MQRVTITAVQFYDAFDIGSAFYDDRCIVLDELEIGAAFYDDRRSFCFATGAAFYDDRCICLQWFCVLSEMLI